MSHTPRTVYFRLIASPSAGADLRALARDHRGEGAELLAGSRVLPASSSGGAVLDLWYDWQHRSPSPYLLAEALFFEVESGLLSALFCRSSPGFVGREVDVDGIAHIDIDFDRFHPSRWRPCRYGFDRVVLAPRKGERIACPEGFSPLSSGGCFADVASGEYLSAGCAPRFWGPDDTPSPEANEQDSVVEPSPLDAVSLAEALPVGSIHWLYRGREVHRAERDTGRFAMKAERGFWHYERDDWDNCRDPSLLAAMPA